MSFKRNIFLKFHMIDFHRVRYYIPIGKRNLDTLKKNNFVRFYSLKEVKKHVYFLLTLFLIYLTFKSINIPNFKTAGF